MSNKETQSKMKGAWWCNNCRVPLITPNCELCGAFYDKPIARDLVPVFRQELKHLRDVLGWEALPKRASDYFLWSSGNSYFRDGRKVAFVSHKVIGAPQLKFYGKEPNLNSKMSKVSSGNGFGIERMLEANRSRLVDIEYESQTFVRATLKRFSSHKPVIAFSGGKDSTVVSHIVRKVLSPLDGLHVFLDTTIEAQDTYRYVDSFQEENPHVPFFSVKPNVDFMEMCNLIGPPSRIHRWCCTSHKAAPMGVFVDILASDTGVLTFDGIRSCESVRRARLKRTTTEHRKLSMQVSASPIFNWSNLELWCYILREDLVFNEAYRKGFRRVGCLYCPFLGPWPEYLNSVWYSQKHRTWKRFLHDYGVRAELDDPHSFSIMTWKGRAKGKELDRSSTNLHRRECLNESSTFVYRLEEGWSEALIEFLKPLGHIHILHQDSQFLLMKLLCADSSKQGAEIRVAKSDNTMTVTFLMKKGLRLFQQRIEKQLKKMQSCVCCGACVAKCRQGAVSVNGSLVVDSDKCIRCLECVSSDCVIVKSLRG